MDRSQTTQRLNNLQIFADRMGALMMSISWRATDGEFILEILNGGDQKFDSVTKLANALLAFHPAPRRTPYARSPIARRVDPARLDQLANEIKIDPLADELRMLACDLIDAQAEMEELLLSESRLETAHGVDADLLDELRSDLESQAEQSEHAITKAIQECIFVVRGCTNPAQAITRLRKIPGAPE
jgi:hypothetical protein